MNEENLYHIVDCGESPIETIDMNALKEIDTDTKIKLTRMTYRIQEFIDKVDY